MHDPIYSEADYVAIVNQQKKRWLLIALPCIPLLIVLLVGLFCRVEWLTTVSTIIIGVILIAGYDLAIKPLHCYEVHLYNSLHGRSRECELPFIRLSENIDLVDGVRFHQLLCKDMDAKGRPYERLFYFDVEKTFPDVKEGDMIHIVHHDLNVADMYLV